MNEDTRKRLWYGAKTSAVTPKAFAYYYHNTTIGISKIMNFSYIFLFIYLLTLNIICDFLKKIYDDEVNERKFKKFQQSKLYNKHKF